MPANQARKTRKARPRAASAVERAGAAASAVYAMSPALLLGIFGTAIFLSAGLLFAVQPMFAKMVLPNLGGAPQVWSVAMVFFQAVLLAGYAYAHLITRHLTGRQSVIVHLAVMAIATFWLPLSIAAGWGRAPAEGEALWLLGLFAISIGLPFFALSANAPLLQAWFARTDHPAAKDPYFLYAASNVGSFLALLSYPFVVEPFTRLGQQARAWSILFYVLIALIAVCGLLLWQTRGSLKTAAQAHGGRARAPTWLDAGIWIGLAAVPSALLIAITAHLTTDVAAAPFFWVIPLALYLATFVIAFQRKRIVPHWLVVAVQPVFIAALLAVYLFDTFDNIFVIIGINLAAFFVIALVCHGELAERRPPAQFLTEFYLWLSTGGVVGGIAAGLVAPHVFNWVAEYPLLIVLAALCRPNWRVPTERREQLIWAGAVALAAAILIPGLVFKYVPEDQIYRYGLTALLLLSFALWNRTLLYAGSIALVLIASHVYVTDYGPQQTLRSFFGVHKIFEAQDGQFRVLLHGTTTHGAQRVRDDSGNPVTGRPENIMYYYDGAAMGQAMIAVRERKRGPIRYAVIGLGAGSLACRMQPGDTLHYYEIDPVVIRIAQDTSKFTYLASCTPNIPVVTGNEPAPAQPRSTQIVLGDARLTLADAPDGFYDLIIVDAFSSDAIPVHLLTREAMGIYKRKLAPGGVVVMHVSNRHLELASVVAGIAHANDMVARVHTGENDKEADDSEYKYIGTVTAAARSEDDFGTFNKYPDWRPMKPDPRQRVWTDDYSNIIGAMLRHYGYVRTKGVD
jgi:SAM-dependent methyltransferase